MKPTDNSAYDPWSDDALREEVLDKFARRTSGFQRAVAGFRWGFKRLVWRLVIGSTHAIKRLIDIFGAGVGLLLLSPVFLFTWLAIKIEDPGPGFYVQQRVGKWGQLFPMIKFRSMVVNADALKAQLLDQNESEAGVIFKMKEDPRITRVGKFIRKYSIDELPQLVNVLRGEMSLVGPRPPVPNEVAEYSLSDRQRLEVKPGITCLWQIGGRSDIDFEGQVRLDVQYIREQSLRKDIVILLKTIPAVILGKGAY